MTDTELMDIYVKDKRRKVALRKACENSSMDFGTKELYLSVLDNVKDAICRLEGDHYISEDSPEFANIKNIYNNLLGVQFSIESRLAKNQSSAYGKLVDVGIKGIEF